MNYRHALGLLLTLTLLSARAQEQPAVSVSLQAFLWPSHAPIAAMSSGGMPPRNDEPREIAFARHDSDTPVTFSLLDNRLSPMMRYSGRPDLTFYADSGSGPVPVGQLKVPLTAREMTVFFFTLGNGQYRLFPIETSAAAIPSGKILIYNLSTSRLACKVDETSVVLDSGKSSLVDVELPSQHYQPILVASLSQNGKWKRSLARKLIVNEKDRTLLVLYNLEANPDSYNLLKLDFPAE